MNRFQYTPGKAPPQYICGVMTATTGQPCKRGVSFEGDRCMYHKEHPVNVEIPSDGNFLARTRPTMISVQVRKFYIKFLIEIYRYYYYLLIIINNSQRMI